VRLCCNWLISLQWWEVATGGLVGAGGEGVKQGKAKTRWKAGWKAASGFGGDLRCERRALKLHHYSKKKHNPQNSATRKASTSHASPTLKAQTAPRTRAGLTGRSLLRAGSKQMCDTRIARQRWHFHLFSWLRGRAIPSTKQLTRLAPLSGLDFPNPAALLEQSST